MRPLQLLILAFIFIFSSCKNHEASTNSSNDVNYTKKDLSLLNLKGPVKRVHEIAYQLLFNNNISETKFINEYIYSFNEDGNLINKLYYNSDSIVEETHNYFYNDKGLKIKEITIDSNNIIIRMDSFVYENNKKNYYASKGYYLMPDKIEKENKYKYDDQGNIIEDCQYQTANSNLDSKYIYKYDVNGSPVEVSSCDDKNKIVSQTFYKYNEKNIPIQMGTYRHGDLMFNIKYKDIKFDQFGNWVKETLYLNDKIYGNTIREIFYY